MTDRIRTLTVGLDKEYRTDDVQVFIDAIKMIKGVKYVQRGKVHDSDAHFARRDERTALAVKLQEISDELLGWK